jgi:hypothetical protein
MYFNEIRELIANEVKGPNESNRHQSWRAVGVVVGLAGGLGTGIFGAVITLTSWITWTESLRHYEQALGTALLILTIPLLALGAHCLDLIESRKNK